MSPVNQAGSLIGTNFTLGSYEKPRSREPSQLALSYEHNENFAKASD